jgi:hypothetical protein
LLRPSGSKQEISKQIWLCGSATEIRSEIIATVPPGCRSRSPRSILAMPTTMVVVAPEARFNADHARLGDIVSDFIAERPKFEIANIVVTQSSDSSFSLHRNQRLPSGTTSALTCSTPVTTCRSALIKAA